MFSSCLKKQQQMIELFAGHPTEESKYQRIIELGRQQLKLDPALKSSLNIVQGCQSTMYLHAKHENGFMYFTADSEALISAGLAAILISVYNGEPPEVVLKCPPDYLKILGIGASLTPSRANGLYSIHLRMKQEALALLINKK